MYKLTFQDELNEALETINATTATGRIYVLCNKRRMAFVSEDLLLQ